MADFTLHSAFAFDQDVWVPPQGLYMRSDLNFFLTGETSAYKWFTYNSPNQEYYATTQDGFGGALRDWFDEGQLMLAGYINDQNVDMKNKMYFIYLAWNSGTSNYDMISSLAGDKAEPQLLRCLELGSDYADTPGYFYYVGEELRDDGSFIFIFYIEVTWRAITFSSFR